MSLALAFDRSERFKDQDGHLHVKRTNLSKATVNPYKGSEIPNYQVLGLDPGRIYQLLRDPAELAKSAPTFNNLRLMSRHVAVSAADPQEKLVAGSTGTDARFESPYLVNSLVVWRQEDIDDVESQEKCQLSCGYYYDADMTPGTFEGLRFDGVMRNIRGNHVALVEAGRAGPDVLVHDSRETVMPAVPLASRKALEIKGALTAYLRPKLMPGTVLALDAALGTVNGANWQTQKAKVLAIVTAAVTPKLATDASIKDLPAFLGAFDESEEEREEAGEDEANDEMEAMDAEEEAEETEAREREEKENKSAEDRAKGAKDRRAARDKKRAMDKKAMDKAAKDKAARDKRAKDKAARDGESEEEREERERAEDAARDRAAAKDKKAMDAMSAEIRQAVTAQMNAAIEARQVVRPLVGEVALALDTAEAIYKFTLTQHKVPIDGVHPSAFGAMVRMIPRPGSQQTRILALDSAATGGLDSMFPQGARIRQS